MENTTDATQAKPASGVGKIVGILAALLLVALYFLMPSNPDVAASAEGEAFGYSAPLQPDEKIVTAAPIDITAVELEKAYDDNEVAAQMRFDGHPLNITGNVKRIDLDGDDNAVLFIDTGAFLAMGVDISPDQKVLAAGLAKGQTITFQCASVTEVLSKPKVKDCAITNPAS